MYAEFVHQIQHRWWINTYQCPAKVGGGGHTPLGLGPYLQTYHSANPAILLFTCIHVVSTWKMVNTGTIALNKGSIQAKTN
jgi:hypothetical protein